MNVSLNNNKTISTSREKVSQLDYPYALWDRFVFKSEMKALTAVDIQMYRVFHTLIITILNAQSPFVASHILGSPKKRDYQTIHSLLVSNMTDRYHELYIQL